MPTPYTMKFIIMVWLAFLARHRPGLHDGEAGLHEHDEEAGDQRPDEVDGDLVLADLVDDVGDRQPLLRVADRDVGDGAGEGAARIALGLVLGFGASMPFRSASVIGTGAGATVAACAAGAGWAAASG